MNDPLPSYDRIVALMEKGRLERSRAIVRALRRALGWPRAVMRSALAAWRWRAAYRDLQALDDRTLKDIGIYRGDLLRIAQGAGRFDETPAAEPAVPGGPKRDPANDNPRRIAASAGTPGRAVNEV
ncbi:MAG: hypothetical protein ACK4QW_14485 [Alphaproteobacteria bacterium]